MEKPTEKAAEKWKPYELEKPLEETILYDKVSPNIARITLNRPEKHNSFFFNDMMYELIRKLDKAVYDDEVKVIILKGNGPSFCTGDDLNRAPYEAYGGKPGEKLPQRKRLLGYGDAYERFKDVTYCRKNVIAQVHGWVMGMGTRLITGADIAIAGESARFAHREQRIGFGGYFGDPLTLLHLGPKKTREWLLTGRILTAQEAKEWGLVNAVVPDDKLEEETLRWANAVAQHSADGLMIGKLYMLLMFDAMGVSESFRAGIAYHTVFSNLVWGEDEFNFLKMRTLLGTSEAFRQREARWERYGF
ncbi:MAG: enoyl-CoA hydratase/isomerase family protein [Chloroflexi bacterium]|nr:enoyl-CoA hydratase/isomerase family protein [Chloroflexota bacterium]